MKPIRLATLFAVAALVPVAAACGDDDDAASTETTQSEAAAAADLGAIKGYLTEHSAALADETAKLKEQGQAYYDLAKKSNFNYQQMLEENRDEVNAILEDAKATYIRANPAYEEMEGIVAGVSSLADYDVIIDAGSSGDDPENAVPFDLELPNGKTLEQPGNFMFLTETALYGTNDDLTAKGAKADLNGDGEVEFGEALPDANIFLATTRDFDKYARELDSEAQGLRAHGLGRLLGARDHDPDDVGVLRGVEELPLRLRQQGERAGLRRDLATLRHRRHPRGPRLHLRRRAAARLGGGPAAGQADQGEPAEAARASPPTCARRRTAGASTPPRRRTRWARRRRSRPRRSPGRSRRRPPSSTSSSRKADARRCGDASSSSPRW